MSEGAGKTTHGLRMQRCVGSVGARHRQPPRISPRPLVRRDCRISPNHLDKNRSRGDLSRVWKNKKKASRGPFAASGERPSDDIAGVGGQISRRRPLERGLGGGAANRFQRAPALEGRKQARRDLRIFRIELERKVGEESVAFSIPP